MLPTHQLMYTYSGAVPLQMCPLWHVCFNNIVQTANITTKLPHLQKYEARYTIQLTHAHPTMHCIIYPMATTLQVLCLFFNFTYRVVRTVNKVVYMKYYCTKTSCGI